ncbi:rod shape-determining protein MreD [Sporosarcina sp. G11-34]|uniref:rod shape-determining protein MreD n=1 Tax=Sporosarcina sp. G11-34 TaxID=2849605 RepID=UPI0022A98672|nr:rod shape-determining protein MreD [Sporosarcina sp. G11-34]MCZ2259831.1 rod shape-determining protein MreD [Sporosarcina sp. G11-34]
MIRSIIPLIAILLFFLEPVFSMFSPISLGEEFYTLVPRFVIAYLIFIAVYYSQKDAIIYGFVFGLLYDIFYIDIIGLYAFLYPLICFIAAYIIHRVNKNIVTVMLLILFLIALLEVLSYTFASFIAITTIGPQQFLTSRLVPTMISNSLFVIMIGLLFKKLIDNRVLLKRGEIL